MPVAYFRAAAVIGAGSESFRTVFYLVKRLPVMVTPRWVTTRTQPIAAEEAVAYLAAAADLEPPLDRELQIGGPDVTTYGGMIDELPGRSTAARRCGSPCRSSPRSSPHSGSASSPRSTPASPGR